ncbi:MAG: hypothetical protein ACYTXC_04180, partial [Nostoc sp.]
MAIFREFSEKLFVLVFACVKAPTTAIFTPKQRTQILHEVLWAKGRLLTLAIFREFSEKLFVLVFACVKAPTTAIF